MRVAADGGDSQRPAPGRPRDLRPPERYTLPVALRPELAQAWGVVVDTPTLASMLRPSDVVVAVGDIVSLTLQELGVRPRLFVCDYATQRGPDPALEARLGAWGDREVRVANPPGAITRQAWDAVREALAAAGTTRIVVDGEEDLLGIPCFIEAPDGTIVIYGMPGQGIVVCPVTLDLRGKVMALVARFEA